MLTVHHLNNSRSQRLLWLLEELELPYTIKRYERDAKTMLAPPELKAVHPLGKSPLLTDGDLTLAESGAIIEYLLDRYGQGRLRPTPDASDFLRYRFWMHYAEGSLMPLLVMSLVTSMIPKRSPLLIRPIAGAIVAGLNQSFLHPQLRLHMDYVESELAKGTWFVGNELTAADIQMSFPLEAAGSLASKRPHIAAFVERMRARPAYQRAIEKGGALTLAPR